MKSTAWPSAFVNYGSPGAGKLESRHPQAFSAFLAALLEIKKCENSLLFMARDIPRLAVAREAGLRPVYARVCLEGTLPFARRLEGEALPNVERILVAARKLLAVT